jgi:hypothetical protein
MAIRSVNEPAIATATPPSGGARSVIHAQRLGADLAVGPSSARARGSIAFLSSHTPCSRSI